MEQKTLTVGANAALVVRPVPGDLRVAGWERSEIMAKTDGEVLDITTQGDQITISCDEDLILYLPRRSPLTVEGVSGDASLQALSGAVTLGPVAGSLTLRDAGDIILDTVAGDLSLRMVGSLKVGSVSGDFALRGGRGDCTVGSIGSDASLRDVEGKVALDHVGSDLYVRAVGSGVKVVAGSDATLYLDPLPGQEYTITAGDDILLRLPPDANVELHLTGGSAGSIHVDFPNVKLDEESQTQTVTLGSGAAKITLTAGDELVVTSRAERWESAADFGVGLLDGVEVIIPPIPPLPPDFSERINRRLEAAMERAHRKAEVAMRRAEVKVRAAEARSRRMQAHMRVGPWKWDLTPHGPVEKGAPVSDEERLAVLRMLQEKKITLEEAEKLLAALEGKGE